MQKKKVTIHEIAKALNINSSTVSRALNNSNKVTKKTKEKVLLKAKEMGYQRNLMASNLRLSRSNTIGVVVPRISRHFFSSTISGIEEAAYLHGYNVIICQSLEELNREQRIVENLIAARVDGILISISMETQDSSHLRYFKENDIPLIFFDRHCEDMPEASKVLIDDFRGAFEGAQHLINKRCRKIAYLSGPLELGIYKNRLKGYKAALIENEILYDKNLVSISNLMEEDGIEFAEKLLQAAVGVDGILFANDVAAVGALKYLKRQGIKVPEDIAIVGFSNEPISEVIEPSLTTIDQSGFEIGKIASDMLISCLKEKKAPIVNRTIILQPSLIKRESTNRK